MAFEQNKVGAIILAAGKGKRMRSDKLKVMHELNGRPLVGYVAAAVEKSAVGRRPVVVVCQDDPAVQNYLGDRAEYVVQEKPLGTGHAVGVCETLLKNKAENIIVLYGDLPLVSSESINKLIKKQQEGGVLTLATTQTPSYGQEYAPLYTSARVQRDNLGNLERIIEIKDCTEEQLKIKEINTGFYCFQAGWLWDHLRELKNNNAQGEYYLTDLIAIAINNKEKILSINIDPKEAMGINTKEDLAIARNFTAKLK